MLDGPTAPLCPRSGKIQDSVQNIVETKEWTQKIVVNFMRAFHNCGNNKMIFSYSYSLTSMRPINYFDS